MLTVQSIETSCQFYENILGMQRICFGDNRTALTFGQQKINLHPAEAPFTPNARHPAPGSADLCLLTSTPMEQVQQQLSTQGIAIIEGPVVRTGAQGPLLSIYIRDPDGNLIELANQHSAS